MAEGRGSRRVFSEGDNFLRFPPFGNTKGVRRPAGSSFVRGAWWVEGLAEEQGQTHQEPLGRAQSGTVVEDLAG